MQGTSAITLDAAPRERDPPRRTRRRSRAACVVCGAMSAAELFAEREACPHEPPRRRLRRRVKPQHKHAGRDLSNLAHRENIEVGLIGACTRRALALLLAADATIYLAVWARGADRANMHARGSPSSPASAAPPCAR